MEKVCYQNSKKIYKEYVLFYFKIGNEQVL